MNDGIDPEMCSLQYTLVEKVARVAQRLGKDTLLAKVDIQAAYCLVPIHPDNCPLLRVGGGGGGGGLFFCLFWFVVSHSIINLQTSKSCTCIHLGVPPGVNILVAVCNANFH